MTDQNESRNAQTLDLAPLLAEIEAAMPRFTVPGVAVGVLSAGRQASAGLGITHLENPLPVDDHTFFQIGSITKTITATTIMRLLEQGQLDLDVPLRQYLPDLRLMDERAARAVTARHLLNHTSGWAGDFFQDFGRGADALALYVAAMEGLDQLTPPGEIYAYNNAGFSLAGRLIEVVTGMPYETAAHQWVLDPLGMQSSFFFPEEVISYRTATGHMVLENGDAQVARPWALARSAHSAGGLVSCVADLLVYARFVLGDGCAADGMRLLKPQSMLHMQSPQAPTPTLNEWVGLSWFIRQVGDVKLIRHGGATHGQCAQFLAIPERQFALVFLTNSDYGSSLYTEVTGWALAHFLGIQPVGPALLWRSEADLATFAGWYDAQMDRLEVTARDGQLLIQDHPKGGFPDIDSPPPPTPPPDIYAFVDEARIVCVEGLSKGSYGCFLMEPQGGVVAWLQLGGRLHRRLSE